MKTPEKQDLRHPLPRGQERCIPLMPGPARQAGFHGRAQAGPGKQNSSNLLSRYCCDPRRNEVNFASCPHYVMFFMREDSIDSSLILGALIPLIIGIKFSLYIFN
ncbi:hypothetical protein FYB76_16080 [Herbaspirillum sp. CAH-3]|nr:hypothetical protein [Herbaspirillum sp. CAH-3]